MTTKSASQRILEAVAVVVAVSCLGALGYSLYASRQEKPASKTPEYAINIPPSPPAQPSSPAPTVVARRGPYHSADIGALQVPKAPESTALLPEVSEEA